MTDNKLATGNPDNRMMTKAMKMLVILKVERKGTVMVILKVEGKDAVMVILKVERKGTVMVILRAEGKDNMITMMGIVILMTTITTNITGITRITHMIRKNMSRILPLLALLRPQQIWKRQWDGSKFFLHLTLMYLSTPYQKWKPSD